MIDTLSSMFLTVMNLLPVSPFRTTLDGQIFVLDLLPYLNWFIPFDNCLELVRLWLPSVCSYYIYCSVKDIIGNYIF